MMDDTEFDGPLFDALFGLDPDDVGKLRGELDADHWWDRMVAHLRGVRA